MITLTEQQAYAAMFHFLDDFYRRTNSDDVGSLLGSMSLLADGGPADPAITEEWREAVRFAIEGGKADSLELAPVRKGS
jgi:hypothetical protein